MVQRIDLKERAGRLREFFVRERRMPGYDEMLELFGYRSKNAVHELLGKLAAGGFLIKKGRKMTLADRAVGVVRLLGAVQAGFPSPAEEELNDTVSLNEYLVERPEATFMLRVEGDSMLDAGIYPGDMVLVEKGLAPANHDIVIAQVDGEWTMKYFVKDASGVHLEPANRKYSSIYPKNTIEIAGVVRTVIRKYK